MNRFEIADFLADCAHREFLIREKNIPGISERAQKRAEHFLVVCQLFRPCKYPTVLEVFIFGKDDIPL